jgi:hypothetical protein
MKKITFILATFLLCNISLGAQSVSVGDFGLQPNTREIAVPYVRKAIEHCKEKGVSLPDMMTVFKCRTVAAM